MSPYLAEGGPYHGHLVCLSGPSAAVPSTLQFEVKRSGIVWRGRYVLDKGGKVSWQVAG